ncbi:hypothetical protein HYH03_012227 [Edaphochlamys debaryana]|uniref:Uncharacterized protein n=1 Tax=Edaphochlamys debaryana TaxID=47281 RepID=A0A835XUE0_9CHLO|nr:hypothetical protein HYH03_012227 [Edaphochlamys debaryana]|eukprot:KAG2489203.1 hypothetical protein HYH03_012227 [Edaphochlamys debaryana]
MPGLEGLFCHMAARAAQRLPPGGALLRGLPGAPEDRRAAAMALRADMQSHNWYQRAYTLHFLDAARTPLEALAGRPGPNAVAAKHEAAARGPGAGPRPRRPASAVGVDRAYVMDERTVREEMMTNRPASAVALLEGVAVSREARCTCPVLSGALLAGLLPHPWPGLVEDAAAAASAAFGTVSSSAEGERSAGDAAAGGTADAGAAVQGHQPYGSAALAPYEAVARAALEQASVRALDDKADAESVLAACAAGTLPPWTRHVVQEHVEWIEFLPYHLMPYAAVHSAAAASGAAEVAGATAVRAAHAVAFSSTAAQEAAAVAAAEACAASGHAHNEPRALVQVHGACTVRPAAAVAPRPPAAPPRRRPVAGTDGPSSAGSAALASSAAGPSAGSSLLPPRTAAASVILPDVATALAAAAAAVASLERLSDLVGAAAELTPPLAVAAAAGFELPVQDLQAAVAHSTALIAGLQELKAELGGLTALHHALFAEAEAGMDKEEGGEEGATAAARAAALASAGLRTWATAYRDAAQRLSVFLSPTRVLGPEGAYVRRVLAAALEQASAAAAVTAAHLEPECATFDRRNDDLFRLLPFDLPPPPPPADSSHPASGSEAQAATEVAKERGAAGPSTSATSPPAAAASAAAAAGDAAAGAVAGGMAPYLDAPPPPGWAALGLFSGQRQERVDTGRVVLQGADEDGHRVVHMAAGLLLPVPASAVVVKALRPEDLNDRVRWSHDGYVNVDVPYVALQGRTLVLPPGMQACAP